MLATTVLIAAAGAAPVPLYRWDQGSSRTGQRTFLNAAGATRSSEVFSASPPPLSRREVDVSDADRRIEELALRFADFDERLDALLGRVRANTAELDLWLGSTAP